MAKATQIAKYALVGLLTVFALIIGIDATRTAIMGGASNPSDEQDFYEVMDIYEQPPLSTNGKVASNVDRNYMFNPEMGEIATIYVKDGQTVQKGDLLFDYDNKNSQVLDQIQDLEEEQTQLYNERLRLIRDRKQMTGQEYNYAGYPITGEVYGKGAVNTDGAGVSSDQAPTTTPDGKPLNPSIPSTGDAAIDEVNMKIKEVEKKLIRARRDQKAAVKADYAGIVYVNQDALNNPTMPLVRLVTQNLVINAKVSEYDYHALEVESKVHIYVKATDQNVEGKISAIDQLPESSAPTTGGTTFQASSDVPGGSGGGATDYSNPTTYGFQVIPNDPIHIGFSVSLEIPVKGFEVPETAVVMEGEENYVYLYQDGKAKKVKVTLEKQGLNQIVTKGLKAGDRIIVDPHDLKSGDTVKVQEPVDESGANPDDQLK
ncbi:efflux RND transporter periplasmic adaptor subunit [Atopobacter phocae]|uniref:efflux RND transporter periplasmic adaptor subunit n=1 Tax=Atopobacter phocae TaxID=136492 RepID=UPI000472D8CF|nr:biotin/lipoyl-binding protein [Atopobacter phocae]